MTFHLNLLLEMPRLIFSYKFCLALSGLMKFILYFRNLLDPYDFPKEILDTLYYFPLNLVNSLKYSTINKLEPVDSSKTTIEDTCNVKKSPVDNSEHVNDQTSTRNSSSEVVTDSASNTEEKANEIAQQSKGSDKSLAGPQGDSAVTEGKSESLVTDSSQGKTPKLAGKRQKQKPTQEERAAIKEERAKEVEAARNIILQKSIDWYVLFKPFYINWRGY